MNLAVYDIGTGRQKTARFFLHVVDFYLKDMEVNNEKLLNSFEINLKKMYTLSMTWLRVDIGIAFALKEFPATFEILFGSKIPDEWKLVFQQDVTTENYSMILKIVESLTTFCFEKFNTQKHRQLLYILHVFAYNGLKIALLSKVNRGRADIEGLFYTFISK